MSDVRMPLGKYKGQPLTEVVYADPQYIEWLIGQADLIKRHPLLARGLADLGASGDETPLHNAIQAYFLEPEVQAALIRCVWGEGLRERHAREVLAWRFRTEVGKIIGPSLGLVGTSAPRTQLLRELRSIRKQLHLLRTAQSLEGEELARACRRASHESNLCWFPLSGSDLSSQVEVRLAELETKLRETRERLRAMREQLNFVRAKYNSIPLECVKTFFKQKVLRFEEFNGSDVHLRYALEVTLPNEGHPTETSTFDAWIEIKPYLGDDYPSTLRQMELQRKQAGNQKTHESRFILVIGKFGARGVTLGQLRKIFSHAQFDVVMLEELGCEMPSAELGQCLPGLQQERLL